MTADKPTSYPDDQLQSLMDQRNPPAGRPAVVPDIQDHAKQNQGGGTTGEVGGDRPAETSSSPLVPIDGREPIPGDNPPEGFWSAPLSQPIAFTNPAGLRLSTLEDAGRFLSGEFMTLNSSNALQIVAEEITRAAGTGRADDIDLAGRQLVKFLEGMRLL